MDNDAIDETRFCPSCGHEGNDVMCPVCDEKMESLVAEAEKLPDKSEKKSDIFDDTSLEAVKEIEEKEEDAETTDDASL
jgi:hypothetical protein